MPEFDFDVVHTAEAVLVRIYFRDEHDALSPLAEVTMARNTDFPKLYDGFRREHGWPDVEKLETELLPRLTGVMAKRDDWDEVRRKSAASKNMAEFFRSWLVLKGRGQVLREIATSE